MLVPVVELLTFHAFDPVPSHFLCRPVPFSFGVPNRVSRGSVTLREGAHRLSERDDAGKPHRMLF